jgi:type III pantothenate kinase
MLLAVDVGNTHTVLGVFDGARMVRDWRIASASYRTVDELWLTMRSFFADAGIAPSSIAGVGISSVVPDLTGIYESLARRYFSVDPVTVTSGLDLGVAIQYTDPAAVGADRLCNAVAGYRKYGGPLVIIDFGTATTFDVVSAKGEYMGGVITLGLESTASELHRRAAKLPKIELRFPDRVIGKETESSMQSGVMYGTVDAVEGTIRRISAELGKKPKVIATGGLASIIAERTPVIEACEPSLVLEGIRLIWERVKN